MPKITIVTHCWAVDKPQYAVFLRAQLSSLATAILRGNLDIKVIVCASLDDTATRSVLKTFEIKGILPLWLSNEKMWRRAIGRNAACSVDVDSDLIWFTDCDYLFGAGCLDCMYKAWVDADKPRLIWPRGYFANRDKTVIDQFWQANVKATGLVLPNIGDDQEFVFTPCRRAIGGLQCVSGEWARENGYLPNSKWQEPPERPFPDFRDDVVFRKTVCRDGAAVSIPILPRFYRMRHTEVGYGNRFTEMSEKLGN